MRTRISKRSSAQRSVEDLRLLLGDLRGACVATNGSRGGLCLRFRRRLEASVREETDGRLDDPLVLHDEAVKRLHAQEVLHARQLRVRDEDRSVVVPWKERIEPVLGSRATGDHSKLAGGRGKIADAVWCEIVRDFADDRSKRQPILHALRDDAAAVRRREHDEALGLESLLPRRSAREDLADEEPAETVRDEGDGIESIEGGEDLRDAIRVLAKRTASARIGDRLDVISRHLERFRQVREAVARAKQSVQDDDELAGLRTDRLGQTLPFERDPAGLEASPREAAVVRVEEPRMTRER